MGERSAGKQDETHESLLRTRITLDHYCLTITQAHFLSVACG